MSYCKTGAKIEHVKHSIPIVSSNKNLGPTQMTRLATDSTGPNRSEPDGPEPNQSRQEAIYRSHGREGWRWRLLWSVRPGARHFVTVGEFHISRQDQARGRHMGSATWGAHVGKEGRSRGQARLAGDLLGLLPNEAGCFASREIMDAVTLGYLGMGRGGGGSRG